MSLNHGFYERPDGTIVEVYRTRKSTVYYEDELRRTRQDVNPKNWKFLGYGVQLIRRLLDEAKRPVS